MQAPTYSAEHVLVVGSGWVGRQIAANLAQAGVRVDLSDVRPEAINDALEWLRMQEDPEPDLLHGDKASWKELAQAGRPLKAITSEVAENSAVDLVIECVPEQLSIKKRVLRQLSTAFGAGTIIVSNSSYFVPSLLADFVTLPQRFAHMHFHVPVLKRSVIDISGGSETAPEVLDVLERLANLLGHHVLRLRQEHPGYVFNWLLQSVLKSSLELVAKGVVDPAEVDLAWTTITHMPKGPFGMMDQIGLDVIEQVLSNARWSEAEQISYDELIAVIRPLISQGNLGVKTGSGFYDYGDNADPDTIH